MLTEHYVVHCISVQLPDEKNEVLMNQTALKNLSEVTYLPLVKRLQYWSIRENLVLELQQTFGPSDVSQATRFANKTY